MPFGDQINPDMSGGERDIGVFARGRFKRLLYGQTGRIIDMNDPARGMAAFLGQVKPFGFALVEWHPEFGQSQDRCRRIFNHEFHGPAVIQTRTGDHCVFNMRFERVPVFENRRDAALRPGRRTGTLRQHHDPGVIRKIKRAGQSRSARSHNNDVAIAGLWRASSHRQRRIRSATGTHLQDPLPAWRHRRAPVRPRSGHAAPVRHWSDFCRR